MSQFYHRTIKHLIREGQMDPAKPTLVVAGGQYDQEVLLGLGFTDVTISNLDERMTGDEFAPYHWRFLDGEDLDVADASFDQVIVHMGLHHCGSPHRGLLEMYRAARNSVLVFENRDSLAMKLAVRLGFVPSHEFEAVAGHGFRYGGYRNTGIPNAVYRWTEREVEKILQSWDPAHQVPIRYFYGLRLPEGRIALIRNGLLRGLFRASLKPFTLIATLFPHQMNEFGIFIHKGARKPQAWIDNQTGALSRDFWGKAGWKEPEHDS